MWHNFFLKFFRKLSQPKRFAIFEACLIGLVAALAAVCLKQGVGVVGGWRVHATHLLPALFVLPGIGLGGGFLAGWLVEQVAPEASGSGIPQVKAVLAREPIALNLRVALIKLVSGILALGSGLPLGREGPTVQVGAALANQLSRWVPTSPDYRRQLIAAGAGAGLAAAFNTPIAGVLFVVEELLQDVSGFTLGTAILASFIGAVVSRWLGGHSLNLDLTTLQTNFSPIEIPFYLVMGVLAGLLGALFNQGVLASLTFNRRLLRFGLPIRVGLAGLVCGGAIALLPDHFRDSAGLKELLTTGQTGVSFTIIAFIAQFILTLLAYGSGAPGGLFAPVLILGAALGSLVGLCQQSILGVSAPVTYALAGMGAFFGAVVRVPITGIVIVFEMTTDFNLVLPLMISSVVAYLVAEKVVPGSLYDRLLEWSGIHLKKEPTTGGLLAQLRAADVMQRRVETLSAQMNLEEAVQAFSHSQHRNFPVVEKGKLVGIITQKDLADIAKERLGGKKTVRELMTPEPVTVHPTDTLAHVLHLLNRYNLSCLPVTEGRKLVGIITRSDIIRAEADHFNGEMEAVGPKPAPSYVVYQTRAPATGKGRLLVPLSHPDTAATLVQMAAAIAKERDYELELLHVMVVPRNQPPAETAVRTPTARRLLRQAQRLAQAWHLPIHTQIRVAHEVSGAILETVKERHIDLVLMGWKGSTSTPGRVFSRVVDTVIRQAACEVVLAKLNEKRTFNRWLVPMAGGPNASEAVRLLPALVLLSQKPEIKLCQVFQPSEPAPDTAVLEQSVRFLKPRVSARVSATPVRAHSVPEAVISLAQHNRSDAIILGASRDRLLQQAIKGNIPETISRNSDCTVILVRSA
ncbi:chloride channel protein [Allocoleopsis sp.]|uniref:chloride channel protein n=1 Tax=Allocoleopsis sp. TaxID=3088169 RepID=UPI002FD76F93